MRELGDYGIRANVHDPLADPQEALHKYGLPMVTQPVAGAYDGIVLAVAHRQFRELGATRLRALGKAQHVLYDLKYILQRDESDLRL